MRNGGPHDPIRIRDNRRFLVIVAVLLGLAVVSLFGLSVSNGTLGRPATWIALAVLSVLMLLAIRARIRTWPPEAGRVDEFTSWAGLKPTRHHVSGSFGDRLQEYASLTLAVRVVRDKGQWSIDVSDRAGRPDEWYDAALLRDLLDGGGSDVLTFPEQVAVVEHAWNDIAVRFSAERREQTHTRLAALRTERAARLFQTLRDPQALTPPTSQVEPTPGWRFLYIGVDGPVPALGGIDPWKQKWRSVQADKIVVAHPSYPNQRHEFGVYEIDGPAGPIRFATGEYSNCIWGIFVPGLSSDSEVLASEVARRARIALTSRGRMQFVAAKDAPAFLDVCADEGVRVLGIEGFRVESSGVTPDMDAIADFSIPPGPGTVEESIRASRTYLRAVKPDLMFEFVLDRPSRREVT